LLLPILRSQAQGAVLAQLYLHPDTEYSLTDLARILRTSVATIHHEVQRLTEGGLVTSRRVGNVRLVSADTTHRLTRPLTDLLAATYGPLPVMADLLAPVADVDEAFIYGSWAARYQGQPGPVPVDLDVVVVGSVDLDVLDDIERAARDRLGFEVNIQRVSPEAWNAGDDPFLAHVQSQPIVTINDSKPTT